MSELTKFALGLFLFRGLDEPTVSEILDRYPPTVKDYKRQEVIYSPTAFEKKIGFVVSGRCEVRRTKHDGGAVSINALGAGDSFGVLAVFSEEEFPTEVYAARASEVLFFDKETVIMVIKSYPEVAMNVITFLAGRVSFLNGKINTFSGTRVEERLASYILQLYRSGDSAEIAFNCKKASEAINSGRASVYRAIDVLAEDGLISYENKKIILNDPEGLERITK